MMMTLTKPKDGVLLEILMSGLADCSACGDLRVRGVNIDSRKIRPGDLFLACHGTHTSGVRFLREAIDAGASAVAVEADAVPLQPAAGIPVLAVSDLRAKAGIVAARFYDNPSEKMQVIGVTGTNGKTSVSFFIAQALAGITHDSVGLMGTLGCGPYPLLQAGFNTTPDPVTVQSVLADFNRQGINRVVMEVTSIGLDQGRVNGVNIETGIFTNLTVDHLDYHRDMSAYGDAKKRLFAGMGIRNAVINRDDAFGRELIRELPASVNVIGYGLVEDIHAAVAADPGNTVLAQARDGEHGLSLSVSSPWGRSDVNTAIGGMYNAYNLLACLSALCLSGIPFTQAAAGISLLSPVPGRMERFGGGEHALVYVDYAHTPDALKHALDYVRRRCRGKLLCVFGCGGDRDRSKRPQMGAIAETGADAIILTSDNPRHEDPQAIINDILDGISRRDSVRIEPDRNRAITAAIKSTGPGDVVLVAGKGHETYQEIAGQRYPYSDRQVVRNLIGAGT
jgi:UDP-N-acetylmuramoyl-L-alanyl-D-glutamate--2,6-diaminopimelate ligase